MSYFRGHGGRGGYKWNRYFDNDNQEHEHYQGRHEHRQHQNYDEEGYVRGHGRGNRGKRGSRHEHRGHRNYDEDSYDRGHGREDRDHRGSRPPPGLRGREIGLWYAKRSNAKKQNEELQQRPEVSMQGREEHIQKLLADIDDTQDKKDEGDRGPHSAHYHRGSGRHGYRSGPRGRHGSYHDRNQRSGATSSGASCNDDLRMSADSQLGLSKNRIKDDMETSQDDGSDIHVPDLDELYKLTQEEQDLILEDWDSDKEQESIGDSRSNSELMLKELSDKEGNHKYEEMMRFRQKLPSYSKKEEIISMIRSNQVTVISGETGCGKTTQVPQFILDDCIVRGEGSQCHIICTQPRRISAVSVAQRVADERVEKCGQGNSVGYSIRLERKMPRHTGSILFCTTGILIKYLESDPDLSSASHIIVDEIHERDLLSDMLLIILKDILPKRPDLKVILMSATLNAKQFSRYFNNCPTLNIPGYTYPVKEYKLEDVLEMTGYIPPPSKKRIKHGRKHQAERKAMDLQQWNNDAWCRNMEGNFSQQTINSLQNMDQELIDLDLIHSLIRHIVLNMEDGAILVFVPGWEQISTLHKILNKDMMFSSANCKIIPLHSLMPTMNQKEVFNKPPPGVRKIVIATNIAETSITIDDVVFVIDCGKIKVKDFIAEQNLTTLEAQWVSTANARQRRGRAGRVQPGHCFHLYTSLREMELRDYIPPEMLRTRLEELCLSIKLLKLGKIEPFVSKAMEKPSMEAVHNAVIMLQNLQALDKDENLLPLGYHLARMPVDPQSGKMILFGAMFGCLDPVCTVAASLSFKDAFTIPLGKEKEADAVRRRISNGSQSDHIMLINAFQGWERAKARGWQESRHYCYDNFLSENTLKLLSDMKRQFADLLRDIGFVPSNNPKDPAVNIHSDNLGLVKAVICAGLYPNVAKIEKVPRTAFKTPVLSLSDGKRIAVHPKSVNAAAKQFSSKWFVYHTMIKTTKIWLHDMTGISPYALLFFGGKISTAEQLWEDEMKSVVIVDDWVRFWCPAETAELVKKLRQKLDNLLEEKITKTGVTNWDKTTKEGALMHAITDLITMEEENSSYNGDTER